MRSLACVSSFAFGGWVTLHVLSASVLHSVLHADATLPDLTG
jgi:hypothetical protein